MKQLSGRGSRRERRYKEASLRMAFQVEVVLFAVLAGSTALLLLEQAVEGGDAWKARLQRNLCNGEIRLLQKLFRDLDAPVAEIGAEGVICILFKQSGKMVFTEADGACNILQIQFLRVMGIDVIHHGVEFLYIFFLFIYSDI